jgi:hypothetical protein
MTTTTTTPQKKKPPQCEAITYYADGTKSEPTRFDGKEPPLEYLQKEVGGRIELLWADESSGEEGRSRYVNEEGHLLNLPANKHFGRHTIVGYVVGNVVEVNRIK